MKTIPGDIFVVDSGRAATAEVIGGAGRIESFHQALIHIERALHKTFEGLELYIMQQFLSEELCTKIMEVAVKRFVTEFMLPAFKSEAIPTYFGRGPTGFYNYDPQISDLRLIEAFYVREESLRDEGVEEDIINEAKVFLKLIQIRVSQFRFVKSFVDSSQCNTPFAVDLLFYNIDCIALYEEKLLELSFEADFNFRKLFRPLIHIQTRQFIAIKNFLNYYPENIVVNIRFAYNFILQLYTNNEPLFRALQNEAINKKYTTRGNKLYYAISALKEHLTHDLKFLPNDILPDDPNLKRPIKKLTTIFHNALYKQHS
jgi:hypothetical protein